MRKRNHKYTFSEQSCRECPHYQEVGSAFHPTRYCGGFKRKKPTQFRSSDPAIKVPKWCPRRLSPKVCRIYGFADECSKFMEQLSVSNFDPSEPYIYPIESHYTLRREIPISMTAKQFFQAAKSETLEDLLSDSDLSLGEVIEIDDGLRPYYFGFQRIIPVPIFHPPKAGKNIRPKEEC